MRMLLIRSLLLTLAGYAVWVFAGPRIAAFLDRFYTVVDANFALGNLSLQPGEFTLAGRRWFLTAESVLAVDSRRRVTLASDGRRFTFGPMISCSLTSTGSCYDFHADPGDEVSFAKSRSWLAWPTPFQFSIMNVPLTSWRRHSYYRLRWKKSSGASIEIVWRDEQGFFAKAGWTDGNLQIAPVVTISPSPLDAVIVAYLLQNKGWKSEAYRLESRGAGSDGSSEVTAVIYLKDLQADHPGAGESIEIYVERKTGRVLREVAGQ